jgi:undecaprenyl pyrophosphate synthase
MSDVYWPDFSGEHLVQAVREFTLRQRRFGE